jgi:hypothetical protein
MAYLNEHAGKSREGRGAATIAGAPVAGTSEVQTIATTGTPTGGTFKLAFRGKTTAAIAFDAAAAAVQTALRALPSIGSTGVTCGGGPLPTGVTCTFGGSLAARSLPAITLQQNSLTGGTSPTVTVTETTPGVTATLRDAPVGTQVVRTDTGVQYTKTALPGTFVVTGAQT